MSDQQSTEKSEKPSDKKIRDARDQGQIVQSKDFSKFIVLLICLIYMFFAGHSLFATISSSFDLVFKVMTEHKRLTIGLLIAVLSESSLILASSLNLVFIIGAGVFIFILLETKGFIFKEEWIKFDAFNPVTNFKQIFSTANFLKVIKNIGEITVMLSVTVAIIYFAINDFMLLANYDLNNIIKYLSYFLAKIVLTLIVIYFMFACLDFYMEYKKWYNQLKMTKEEVKQENKETQGSPEVKSRQRELIQELLADESTFDPNDASFVLANPTHIAVMILYSPLRWSLPIVLVKTKDSKAFEVFKLAKKFNIPIIRDKWLARTLYKIAEPGKYVPSSVLKNMAALINDNLHILPKVVEELNIVKQRRQNANLSV